MPLTIFPILSLQDLTADFLKGQPVAQVFVIWSWLLPLDWQNPGHRLIVAGNDQLVSLDDQSVKSAQLIAHFPD